MAADASGQALRNSNHASKGVVNDIAAPDTQARRETRARSIPEGAVESFWTGQDGARIRRLDWPADGPAPVRGSILFMPGRGDAYEKYLELFADWHERGWAVTSADWRGQAGSGRLGADPHTGHVADFAIWVDDLARLWADWQATTPPPHVLVGHSMGGHLALRAVAEQRIEPDALVLSAPMLGFTGPLLPDALLHLVAKVMCRVGDPRRPAWRWSEKPGELPLGRQALLTHDDARYRDEVWWREQRPELAMGPGSWGWVERAYASMRGLNRAGVLERIKVPTLILAAEHDRLVGFAATQRAARRLPNSEFAPFGAEARHEILREVDNVRNRVLRTIDLFLDRHVPPGS